MKMGMRINCCVLNLELTCYWKSKEQYGVDIMRVTRRIS